MIFKGFSLKQIKPASVEGEGPTSRIKQYFSFKNYKSYINDYNIAQNNFLEDVTLISDELSFKNIRDFKSY